MKDLFHGSVDEHKADHKLTIVECEMLKDNRIQEFRCRGVFDDEQEAIHSRLLCETATEAFISHIYSIFGPLHDPSSRDFRNLWRNCGTMNGDGSIFVLRLFIA